MNIKNRIKENEAKLHEVLLEPIEEEVFGVITKLEKLSGFLVIRASDT